MDRNRRVRIDALGGDIAEYGVECAPKRCAFEHAVGFEGGDSPLGHARDHVTELLIELGSKAKGFGSVQLGLQA